jgi:competence CoiA-like predicted nuclease
MPLKAKHSETGDEAIILDHFETVRAWHFAHALVCPFCDETVVPVREHQRAGAWVQAYLRHKTECSTTLAHHPESPEHHAAKRWIRDTIPGIYNYPVDIADLEVRMPEINRIADVCFTLKSGERVVHEAQLAAISVDDLEARTNDYQSLGYAVVWHFGKAADTQTNKQWAWKRLGGCEVITFEEQLNAA